MKNNYTILEIAEIIKSKGLLKQKVYNNTFQTMQQLKKIAQQTIEELKKLISPESKILLAYKERNDFEFEITFAGDVLIFLMHTNVFEFSREHPIMKIPYLKNNVENSYCGVINIYNFLADSFKYNRINDLGYLIGRVFINQEMHYYIEGKREISSIYNDFSKSLINDETLQRILFCSIAYTVNFDLLTPPYDQVKIVSVNEMQTNQENFKLTTAKRLGFKFQADDK